jgi:hypothetical protein
MESLSPELRRAIMKYAASESLSFNEALNEIAALGLQKAAEKTQKTRFFSC